MDSRPGGTNLVEPKGQGAALPSGGPAMQPWWTSSGAGLGAVSPAVVAPGSGAVISLSSRPVGGSGGGGRAAKGAASDESSEDEQRSGEPKDGSAGQEINHATSQMPALVSEYLAPYSQLELNQSIRDISIQILTTLAWFLPMALKLWLLSWPPISRGNLWARYKTMRIKTRIHGICGFILCL